MLRRLPKPLTYLLIFVSIAVFTLLASLYSFAWYKNHTTPEPLPIDVTSD